MRWLDYSIYHLDGPGALRHLDALLAIPELNAVQWVCGEGRGPVGRWADVLRRIQDAGKNVQVFLGTNEIDDVMRVLRPEGVMLTTWASSVEEADGVIRKISGWKRP
jgi:hypothetical protein